MLFRQEFKFRLLKNVRAKRAPLRIQQTHLVTHIQTHLVFGRGATPDTLEMIARSEKYMNVSEMQDPDEDDRHEEQRVKVTTVFSQSQKTGREARIDDRPAVLKEPEEHAVTGGRDVSLHHEGGHSPEHHTVALENTDEQQKQPTSETRSHRSRTRCCKLPSRGSRAPTANHQSRRAQRWEVMLEEARNEPRSLHLLQRDSEEAQKEPQPKSQWRKRSEERSKATRARGQREEHRKSGATMKRTEKSRANSRQKKSTANGRQKKSRANGGQSEPKDCEPRQGEVRGETQYKGKLQRASPRCPAGATRAEAWRSDPSHQLQRGNRGV